jgi:hypothetical protein
MRSRECVAAQCIMPIAVVCAGDGATAQIPCRYEIAATITTPSCGIFGPSIPIATAISPNGEYVVGYFYCFSGQDERGFVYRTATNQLSVMPIPVGFNTCVVRDVNDAGLAVGKLGGVSISRGFIFDVNSTQYVTLLESVPSNGTCDIRAINASGTVCGFRSLAGPSPDYPTSAFVWSAEGGIVDLGLINGISTSAVDLNDNDNVCVSIDMLGAGLWSGQAFIDLGLAPGALYNTPRSINECGQVLLQTILHENPQVGAAVTFDKGRWQYHNPLPGFLNSAAKVIANDGLVIGHSTMQGPGGTIARPSLWVDENAVDLPPRVLNLSGLDLYLVGDISKSGLILGTATTPQGGWATLVLAPRPLTADCNADCVVNIDDLLIVINAWGQLESSTDINKDGLVNVLDLLLVIEHWTV